VSKGYAKEVLTPEYGESLDRLLLEVKEKFFGIVNGIDYEEFNPKTDKLLFQNYDKSTLEKRSMNKLALQEEFDLPVNQDIPVFGFVGRLDFQKGVDLIVRTFGHVLKDYNVQFVQVGGGDSGLASMLKELKDTFPLNVGIHPYPNFTLPRKLFAGCDCIMYPSRFEPCGVVQLEAMRYGAAPLVRNVGGLKETVENFDSLTGEGTGFVFNDFDEFSLYGQLVRVVELLKNKGLWRRLQLNAMSQDFSWTFSAKEYVKLYELSEKFRTKTLVTRNPLYN